MSEAVNSPKVVLLEDRPKQAMVFQINLNIYLDARVTLANSLADLKLLPFGEIGRAHV